MSTRQISYEFEELRVGPLLISGEALIDYSECGWTVNEAVDLSAINDDGDEVSLGGVQPLVVEDAIRARRCSLDSVEDLIAEDAEDLRIYGRRAA